MLTHHGVVSIFCCHFPDPEVSPPCVKPLLDPEFILTNPGFARLMPGCSNEDLLELFFSLECAAPVRLS